MSLLVLFLIFAKIAVLTFGGGYAMVPLFEHEIVTRHAFMPAADFANLIGLAQVTPGPIGFNAATYVGMAQGGLFCAVVASLGVMVPSIAISLVVALFLRKAADAKWTKLLMKGVRPCVVGIIGAAVVFFAKTALCWQGAVIFALVVFVRWKWSKLNPIWSLAVSAFLGWVLFL
jgi:chromate transporter